LPDGNFDRVLRERSFGLWLVLSFTCVILLILGSLLFASREAQAQQPIKGPSLATNAVGKRSVASPNARPTSAPLRQPSGNRPTAAPPTSRQPSQAQPSQAQPSQAQPTRQTRQPTNSSSPGESSVTRGPGVRSQPYQKPVQPKPAPQQRAYHQPSYQRPAHTRPAHQEPVQQRTTYQQPVDPQPQTQPAVQEHQKPYGSARPADRATKPVGHRVVTPHGQTKPYEDAKPAEPANHKAVESPGQVEHPKVAEPTQQKKHYNPSKPADKVAGPVEHKVPVPSAHEKRQDVNQPPEPKYVGPVEKHESVNPAETPKSIWHPVPGQPRRQEPGYHPEIQSIAGFTPASETRAVDSLGLRNSTQRGVEHAALAESFSRSLQPLHTEPPLSAEADGYLAAGASLALGSPLLNATYFLLQSMRGAMRSVSRGITDLLDEVRSLGESGERGPPGGTLPLPSDPGNLPTSNALSGMGGSSNGGVMPLLGVTSVFLMAAAHKSRLWTLYKPPTLELVPHLIVERPD